MSCNMSDNIGGIEQVEYCLASDIDVFCAVGDNALIKLIDEADWKLATATPETIAVSVKPVSEDSGDGYDVEFSFKTATNRYELDKASELKNKSVIFRNLLPNGKYMVIGTKDFPLTGTEEKLDPTSPAEFSGYLYSFTNRQPHKQLIFVAL